MISTKSEAESQWRGWVVCSLAGRCGLRGWAPPAWPSGPILFVVLTMLCSWPIASTWTNATHLPHKRRVSWSNLFSPSFSVCWLIHVRYKLPLTCPAFVCTTHLYLYLFCSVPEGTYELLRLCHRCRPTHRDALTWDSQGCVTKRGTRTGQNKALREL